MNKIDLYSFCIPAVTSFQSSLRAVVKFMQCDRIFAVLIFYSVIAVQSCYEIVQLVIFHSF